MKHSSAAVAATALALAAGALLTGCSASVSVSSDSTSAAASQSMVGGPSVCDNDTIQAAMQTILDGAGENDQVYGIDSLSCADGWAVAMPTIGTSEDNAVTETVIFKAEGQFWLQQDRDAVCGTVDPNNMEARPADAQIPEALYVEGCTTN